MHPECAPLPIIEATGQILCRNAEKLDLIKIEKMKGIISSKG